LFLNLDASRYKELESGMWGELTFEQGWKNAKMKCRKLDF